MSQRHIHRQGAGPEAERLMQAMAEHIKLPLMQIARLSELSSLTQKPHKYLDDIETAADSALRFIDGYLLSNNLTKQEALILEPVVISSVLNDVAHQLDALAKQYECTVQLHICGRYNPVLAHRQGLEAALVSLGQAFLETQSSQPSKEMPVLTLAAHKGKKGIVAGVFAEVEGLSEKVYQRGKSLYGVARQPMGQALSGSAAGVFVADSILAAMAARLRVARHHNQNGLAATLLHSQQLSFV